jgi:DUF4097 and DUF4098 domain-containing protein YvlB
MPRAILSLIVTLVFATAASAERLQESFDRTLDVRAGSAVSIDNVNGKITVTSWDQPRVRIHALKKAETRDSLDKLAIDVRTADGVSIVTRTPRRSDSGFLDFLFGNGDNTSVEYDVTVPRSTDLKVENTNGSISVSDITGRIELSTTNGRIEAMRCSGTMNAGTTNGTIRAELLQVSANRKMEFETTNGSITLTLPPTFAADLEADTTNGSIRTDLPVTTRSFSRRELRGTLNGGGTHLSLHTTNGSIEIRSSAVAR